MTTALTDWRAQAVCARRDPELWAVNRDRLAANALAALRICAACPVQRECDQDAQTLDRHRRHSVILAGVIYDQTGRPRRERLATCRQCREQFVATTLGQRYCGGSCRETAQARRAWARVATRRSNPTPLRSIA